MRNHTHYHVAATWPNISNRREQPQKCLDTSSMTFMMHSYLSDRPNAVTYGSRCPRIFPFYAPHPVVHATYTHHLSRCCSLAEFPLRPTVPVVKMSEAACISTASMSVSSAWGCPCSYTLLRSSCVDLRKWSSVSFKETHNLHSSARGHWCPYTHSASVK